MLTLFEKPGDEQQMRGSARLHQNCEEGLEEPATEPNRAPPLITLILFQTLVSVVVCFAATIFWVF
ncbi:MAG: hypothetical protein V2A76_01060 [Planctomycetota bacterium]